MNSKDYYDLLHKKFDGAINKEGLYPAEISQKPLYDTMANFLVAIALHLGGWEYEAENIVDSIDRSCLKNKNGFYNRQSTKSGVVPRHHSCVEGVATFFYSIAGDKKCSNSILKRLFNSPLNNTETGLFYMSMNESGSIIDNRLITHSQLWIALAFIGNKQIGKARDILSLVEQKCTDSNMGVLETMYCATVSTEKMLLPDDSALFAIANELVGNQDKAREILISLKESSLFNKERNVFVYKNHEGKERISSYKNFLCQAAYKFCNIGIPPYNIKHEERFSDSIALGIFAENIYKIGYLLKK